MRKLLIALGVSITSLFNLQHSMAAPPDEICTTLHTLIDANGKVAGQYNPSGPAVIDAAGTLIAVYPERDLEGGQYDASALKWGTNGAALFYAATDCAGAPLINHMSGGPAGTRPAVLQRDSSGNLIAYIGAKGRSATKAYRSWRDTVNGTCTNTWETSVPINTWELEKTIVINHLYPEPLSVR